MYGLGDDTIIALVAIIAIFGPLFYFIYMVGKLIKYRIDRKYSSSNSGELQEMREFRQRTERRLRALEEIIAEQDEAGDLAEQFRYEEPKTKHGDEKETESTSSASDKASASEKKQDSGNSKKLKNQLKS